MDIIQQLERLKPKSLELKKFSNNAIIFKEEDNAEGVYILKEGNVKVLKNDAKKNSVLLWTAEEGEPFGVVPFFLGSENYTCSIQVGEKASLLYFLSYEEFTQLLEEHAEFKLELLAKLCEQISFMELRSKAILLSKTDERIINTLLFLATKKHRIKKNLRLEFSLSELAEMVGASIGHTRKKIRHLKKERIINYGNNWFEINDIERLKFTKSIH